MMENKLDKYLFDAEKLKTFGFVQKGKVFFYQCFLLLKQFELRINLFTDGKNDWDVFDVDTGDVYNLVKFSGAEGTFVGKVRLAVEEVFDEIIKKCAIEEEVFKSREARAIRQYVLEKYGDVFEYLWKKFPDNAVFRRGDNQKWYGAVLSVAPDKLGLEGNGKIEILDLRGSVEEIERLIDGKKYFSGYHMNKKHWFTILLNGSVDLEEIYQRIDASYRLAKK